MKNKSGALCPNQKGTATQVQNNETVIIFGRGGATRDLIYMRFDALDAGDTAFDASEFREDLEGTWKVFGRKDLLTVLKKRGVRNALMKFAKDVPFEFAPESYFRDFIAVANWGTDGTSERLRAWMIAHRRALRSMKRTGEWDRSEFDPETGMDLAWKPKMLELRKRTEAILKKLHE